jgi:DNA-binding XRE family transcriptional regulator
MQPDQVRSLRSKLDVSRADLARFVGVSHATAVRWELEGGGHAPRGVSLVLLVALQQALARSPARELSQLVSNSQTNHALAIQELLHHALGEFQAAPPEASPSTGQRRRPTRR